MFARAPPLVLIMEHSYSERSHLHANLSPIYQHSLFRETGRISKSLGLDLHPSPFRSLLSCQILMTSLIDSRGDRKKLPLEKSYLWKKMFHELDFRLLRREIPENRSRFRYVNSENQNNTQSQSKRSLPPTIVL